jgi:hypothetical protein
MDRKRDWKYWTSLVFIFLAIVVNVLLLGFNILLPLRVCGYHLPALFAIDDGHALQIQAILYTSSNSWWVPIGNPILSLLFLVVFVRIGLVISGPATYLAAKLFRLSDEKTEALLDDCGERSWAKMGPLNRQLKSLGVSAPRRFFRVYGLSAELWFFVLNFVFFFIRYWSMLFDWRSGGLDLEQMPLWGWPLLFWNAVAVCAVAAVTTGIFFTAIEAVIKVAYVRVGIDVWNSYVDEVTLTFVTLLILRGLGLGGLGMFFITLNLALPFALSKWAHIQWRALAAGKEAEQSRWVLAQAVAGLAAMIILPWLLLWLAGGEVPDVPYARDVWRYPADTVEQVLLEHDRGPSPDRWEGVWDTNHGRVILCEDPYPVFYREGRDLTRHGKYQFVRGYHHLPGSEEAWGILNLSHNTYDPAGGRGSQAMEHSGQVLLELALDGRSFTGRYQPVWGSWQEFHGTRVIPPDRAFGPPNANGFVLQPGQPVKVQPRLNRNRRVDAVVVKDRPRGGADVRYSDGTEERVWNRRKVLIDPAGAQPAALSTPPDPSDWVTPTANMKLDRNQVAIFESSGKWYPCRITYSSDDESTYQITVDYFDKGMDYFEMGVDCAPWAPGERYGVLPERLRIRRGAAIALAGQNDDATEPSANEKDTADGMRTWTDSSGKHRTRAKLFSHDSENVQLLKDGGEKVSIPLARLSEADREYLAQLDQSKQSDAFRQGDKVEVLWKSTWYAATVLQVDRERFFIRYVGYSDDWDEWVGPERIRKLTR